MDPAGPKPNPWQKIADTRRRWTEEEVALLGTMPDADLGAKLGRSAMAVFHARSKREIPPATSDPWTPETLALLGTMPDPTLAKIVGLGQPAVSRKRREMGIPTWITRNTRAVDWDSVPFALYPDRAIGLMYGVSQAVVNRKRRALGHPPFNGRAMSVEGISLRSAEEAAVDAWLHATKQDHEHEVHVGIGRYRADFRLTSGQVIEVMGMAGHRRYDSRSKVKREKYESAGIDARWVSGDEAWALYAACSPRPELRFVARCTVRDDDASGDPAFWSVSRSEIIGKLRVQSVRKTAHELEFSEETLRRWLLKMLTDEEYAELRALGRFRKPRR